MLDLKAAKGLLGDVLTDVWAGRKIQKNNGIKILTKFGVIIIALTVVTEPGFARYQYRCATTKVVITSAPGRESTLRLEEHLTFWIDDAAKTVALSDGTRLQVTRFDPSWINAHHGDMEYEFNRADGTLTFAGSTTEGNATTTTVGSGRCEGVPEEDWTDSR